MNCEVCGSEAHIVGPPGVVEVWRCLVCGHEATMHVYYMSVEEKAREDLRNGPPRVFMIARWRERPSKAQAEQVRALLPSERKLAVTRIMRAGFDGEAIDFGPSLRTSAEALAEALDTIGMEAELTPIVA